MSNTPKPTSAPSIEPTSVMQKPDDRPIAISMGDPAGIGPEILLKALCSSERQAIAAIVQEYEIDCVVVGMPLNMSGDVG
ncbi:MAG: hypothetical protein EBW84_02240, partial [Betaproteobacteria bacterium]|nr:hypothetical protein [Betaproteobacteria bacterium]